MRTALMYLFGVILPVCAVILEWKAAIYGSLFIRIARPWPLAGFALLAPIANMLVLARPGEKSAPRLAGLASIVSGIYALLFLPVLPLAVLLIPMYGTGLLAFIPIVAFAVSNSLRRDLLRRFPDARRLVRQGYLLALPAFLLASVPDFAVNTGLRFAQWPPHRDTGIAILRWAGNRESMIMAGCPATGSLTSLWVEALLPVSEREARIAYEAVTGRSFARDAKDFSSIRCTDSGGHLRPPRN